MRVWFRESVRVCESVRVFGLKTQLEGASKPPAPSQFVRSVGSSGGFCYYSLITCSCVRVCACVVVRIRVTVCVCGIPTRLLAAGWCKRVLLSGKIETVEIIE